MPKSPPSPNPLQPSSQFNAMRALLVLLSAFSLASCVGSAGIGVFTTRDLFEAQDPNQPAPYPGGPNSPRAQPALAPPPAQSDYPPHLRDEYRSGHEIGVQDRSYGYPANYQRAYQRFGHGYESCFQEGYDDGYEGRSMRH